MKNICATCGHAFIAANPNRGPKPRYCGRKCWPTTSLPHTKQKDLVACARCATQFSRSQRGGSRARFCSTQCATAHRNEQRRLRWSRADPSIKQQRASGNHRKRAHRHGVRYEPVNSRKVFARDKWICGICHTKVDRRLKWPHHLSASLDHIIPMAHGGDHTYENTQCSHWLCNARKGDRGGGEQLALVG